MDSLRRTFLTIAIAPLLLGVVVAALSFHERHAVRAAELVDDPTIVEWIVIGGGSTPESNEVSIEDDLELATRVVDGPGMLFYAAGADTQAVRVTDSLAGRDPLVDRLGRIFNPRPGRQSSYRKTRLQATDAAHPDRFLKALSAAAAAPGEPLFVYVAGHGDRGETAPENVVVTWGNRSFKPTDIAAEFGRVTPRRTVRFAFTTCFSGGFAELAFDGADASRPATEHDICGVFASTWDREAGGCDPNPDRGRHDGYGVHLLNALDGEDRGGELVAADFDDDNRVSLLDAHTWARLRSGSIDVPTTTSERYLRAMAVPARADAVSVEPGLLPHEDALVARLGRRLEVADEADAAARVGRLEEELVGAASAEAGASEAESNAYWDAAAVLLAKWPVLDDPWHPSWRPTIDRDRDEIRAFLDSAPEVAALEEAMANTDRAARARAEIEATLAPLYRLVRAMETRRLATALKEQGGPAWERFARFRSCENSPP